MKPIFLIGYMGSGKSTVGRVMAEMLGCGFTDLDTYIENRRHKTVKDLFAAYGEEGFRRIEKSLLEEVCEFQDMVVACGGGTPCHGDNMATMSRHGTTVYLYAPTDRLYRRLSRPRSKAKRPVIAGKTDEELLRFIADSLREREVYYRRADIVFDTSEIETAAETPKTAARLLEQIRPFLK